ncbi:MAG: hypothetical protein GC185_00250 [Alphaproteobacteria bacterium]|nr:hypothetical protein [Alphaproteobacteria bacterium]
MKTSLLRPFRFLALAAVLAVCGGVSARAVSISAPVDEWTVGPIRAKSSSGVGYCSMKNTYDDGKSLVFARDAEGSNSIAIDFRKKTLKVGAQYLVSMKVGMLDRSMVAIAATPKVLIVQMGLDRAYYDMLRRKSVMQISYDGNDMAFALNGTSDGLAALTDCANAIGNGRPFAEVSIATTAIPADKLADDVAAVLPSDALDKTGPVAKITPDDVNLGKQAAESTLQKEIAELRAENRKLLLQNQAIAARMAAEDHGRHPLAQPDPPEEIVDMPELAQAPVSGPVPKAVSVKTSAKERANGKTHVISASLSPEETQAVPAGQAGSMSSVEPAAGGVSPDIFLKSLLKRAHLRPMAAGQGRYTWKTGDIYGGALAGPLPADTDFSHAVDNYIEQARTRCGGDFARKMGLVKMEKGLSLQTGEIACIDGKHDVGAALVFIRDGGNLIVVTHEGTTDQMGDALKKRKDVISAISG